MDDLDFTHQCILTDAEDSAGCVLTVSSGCVKTQQPKSRLNFFQLLYSFGQFYLQCFPQKTATFLEYLSFLTKYGSYYPVATLIKLDTSIHRFFVQRPHLNWDVTHPEVSHFIKDADIEVTKLNAASKQNSKLKPRQQSKSSRRSSPYNSNNGQYHPYSHNNNYSGGNRGNSNASTSNDPRDCRCHNYNWRQCIDDPRCFRDHVCYTRHHSAPGEIIPTHTPGMDMAVTK